MESFFSNVSGLSTKIIYFAYKSVQDKNENNESPIAKLLLLLRKYDFK